MLSQLLCEAGIRWPKMRRDSRTLHDSDGNHLGSEATYRLNSPPNYRLPELSSPIRVGDEHEVVGIRPNAPVGSKRSPREDSVDIEVSISLDDDGFLDRQCPSCSRVFRWLPNDDSEPADDGLYGCPYCRVRSDSGDFWTDDQRAFMVGAAGRALVDKLRREGWRIETGRPPADPGLTSDEFTEVSFGCHPSEPLKVYSEWLAAGQPSSCLICGESS